MPKNQRSFLPTLPSLMKMAIKTSMCRTMHGDFDRTETRGHSGARNKQAPIIRLLITLVNRKRLMLSLVVL